MTRQQSRRYRELLAALRSAGAPPGPGTLRDRAVVAFVAGTQEDRAKVLADVRTWSTQGAGRDHVRAAAGRVSVSMGVGP